MVCTNERKGGLSSVIVGLEIQASMRVLVRCNQFRQNSLISGHVFETIEVNLGRKYRTVGKYHYQVLLGETDPV